ncbi:MAG: hypothetical protein HZB51_29195 [Chloroflexi bacterium]|nr:hypothetical protein [Chloroflexota bacterium]
MPSPLPTLTELCALMPDVSIFDNNVAQPELAMSLLEERLSLLLIGVNSGGDQTLFWSGQQSRIMSMQDQVRVINASLDLVHQPLSRLSIIDRVRRKIIDWIDTLHDWHSPTGKN